MSVEKVPNEHAFLFEHDWCEARHQERAEKDGDALHPASKTGRNEKARGTERDPKTRREEVNADEGLLAVYETLDPARQIALGLE